MHAGATEPVMMVLHDLPNGAMRHLDRVLGSWQDLGVTFLATPPESCLPMRDGQPGPRFADLSHPTPLPDNTHGSRPAPPGETRGRDHFSDKEFPMNHHPEQAPRP